MYEELSSYFKKELVDMTVEVPEEVGTVPPISINDVVLQKPAFDGRYFLGEQVKLRYNGTVDNIQLGWRIIAETAESADSVDYYTDEVVEYTIPYDCVGIKFKSIAKEKDPEPPEPPEPPINTETVESAGIVVSISGNQLSVSGLKGRLMVVLFDTDGRKVFEEANNGSETLLIPLDRKGVYIVSILGNEQNFRQKVVY